MSSAEVQYQAITNLRRPRQDYSKLYQVALLNVHYGGIPPS